mgnify:CR=1 FL=1
MSSPVKILFVDDEAQILSALIRVLRSSKFQVITAASAQEGLELLKQHTFDVIISDMRMPEMDGAEFLALCCQRSPASRRILLTGFSDQSSTIRAINEGQVHQYLSKPWDNAELRSTVESEISEKQRIQAETPDIKDYQALQEQVAAVSTELSHAASFSDMAKEELLEHCNTTIKLMSNLINTRMPSSYEMNHNIVVHSMALAKLLKLEKNVLSEIRSAARLHQLGKLAFNDALLLPTQNELTVEEHRQYSAHAVMGADLLTPLHSLDYTAKLIRHQNENYDGTGEPHKLTANKIPLGSRILRLNIDYQMLIHGRQLSNVLSSSDALAYMENFTGKKYDPYLFKIYKKLIFELEKNHAASKYSDHLIDIKELQPKQIISRDVINHEGMLLIAKDTELNESMIEKLKSYVKRDHHELALFINI